MRDVQGSLWEIRSSAGLRWVSCYDGWVEREEEMVKLVLADMDGTLLPQGGENVSYRTIQAVRALLDAGVRFGPATGRQAYELDRRFFGARDCYGTAITANGKRVFVDGELRREILVERSVLERLYGLLSTVPNAFLVVETADNGGGTRPWYCVTARSGDAAWFGQNVGFKAEACDALPDEDAISAEIACAGSDEQYEELIAQARVLVPECEFATSQVHWCDVMPQGVNKGYGLKVLLDELGISRDEVVFFGDADNDLPLMELIPNSVAMANATPAAAAAARWHVGDVADDGAAAALEEIARAVRAGETPAFMREDARPAAASAVDDDPEDEGIYEDDAAAEAIRALLAAKLGPELG